jgi:threonyl-tRNA synthetase
MDLRLRVKDLAGSAVRRRTTGEDGFCYGVDLPHRVSPEDFEKIEAETKKEIKTNHPFERRTSRVLRLSYRIAAAFMLRRRAASSFITCVAKCGCC